MELLTQDFSPSSNSELLLTYVADLELEVDRLRKQGQFLQSEARDLLARIKSIGKNVEASQSVTALADVLVVTKEFGELLRDIYDPPGYHPAHDQVVAIAIRPLVEQIFRAQQRLQRVRGAQLRMELATEHVDWFPARFRHIVDNLLSNSLRYADPAKGEARVFLGLNRFDEQLELRVSDNGLGMPWNRRAAAFELYYRSAPAREAGLGVGLAVVKGLVEQSGGSLTVESSEGQGTSFIVLLPRYDLGDFLK